MTQSVFVTGADKGLGLELVRRFAVAGCRVFAGQYDPKSAIARQVGGSNLVVVPLNIADMPSVEKAARTVASQTEGLDILINNAGVLLESRPEPPLEETIFENLAPMMNVNAFGTLRVSIKFLPLLRKGSRKLLLNISSEAARLEECKYKHRVGYCMSKVAVNMQSKILQNYLVPEGIKVLAVHPGWMKTDMGGPNAETEPSEVAEKLFALTQRSWDITGPIFVDNTGQRMAW